MTNRPVTSSLAPGLMLLVAAVTAFAGQPLEDLAAFPRASLEISGPAGSHHFDVWIADTPPRQAQGLMFVRDLAADAGMLFTAQAPRVMSMWMKNTYIPLDMLFIDAQGRIVHIAARTQPHSLQSITSGKPVTMVLELRGGEAQKRGIAIGDHVRVGPDKG